MRTVQPDLTIGNGRHSGGSAGVQRIVNAVPLLDMRDATVARATYSCRSRVAAGGRKVLWAIDI